MAERRSPGEPQGFDARTYQLTGDVRLRLRREGMSPVTLCVLDALAQHDWAVNGRRKGVVWPKVETLARCVGYTDRTVQTHLGYLIRGGFIARWGNGGRSCPAVVALNWPRIVGEVENGEALCVKAAETVKRQTCARKPFESKKQEKRPSASASALNAPPRRASSPTLPDAVPPPPEVKAALAELFGRIGSLPTSPRPAQAVVTPSRGVSVFTDRAEREAWADAQLARAKEMGLG